MCGFAGIIWKSGQTPDNAGALLDRLETCLVHRGPDEAGRRTGEGFAVVHRRLAIVDISNGHQPMETDDGQVGLAYNGEVYNFQDIRRELEAKGVTFRTNCDTEVVLKGYAEYGPVLFERLNGMFSVFLWDFRREPSGEFYLARDHVGTKPLYVYEDGHKVIASSELRPLLALPDLDLALDREGLESYLTFRYVHAPRTLFKRIRRVEAGTAWRIRKGNVFRWRYWDLPTPERPSQTGIEEASQHLLSLLNESVNEQQMGEVPIGLLLSGGLDSSAIAAVCHTLDVRYHTFNIGFPDVNEFPFSRAVADAFGQEHHTIETTVDEITGLFETVVDAMDEPLGDAACFPLHALCRHMRRYVTVVLSGEGSDEIFGGYPQYGHLLNGTPQPTRRQFHQFLEFSWYFLKGETGVRKAAHPSVVGGHYGYFAERSLLPGMLAYDLKTWLPENLMMKADKILMAHSLEGRFPFLSKKIVEFAATLPDRLKCQDGTGKLVLRHAFQSSLPASILSRPKMGFSVPIDTMLQRMQPLYRDLLYGFRNEELSQIVDLEALSRTVENHFKSQRQSPLGLWTFLVLLQWLRQHTGRAPLQFGRSQPFMGVA
jgi:asparagine synthase (glutamine-hydrolysing)